MIFEPSPSSGSSSVQERMGYGVRRKEVVEILHRLFFNGCSFRNRGIQHKDIQPAVKELTRVLRQHCRPSAARDRPLLHVHVLRIANRCDDCIGFLSGATIVHGTLRHISKRQGGRSPNTARRACHTAVLPWMVFIVVMAPIQTNEI